MLRILTLRVPLLTLAVTMAIGLGSARLSADLDPKGITIQMPKEIKWVKGNGSETAVLVGDPAKPGPYTLRLKFPKGFRIAPHSHPDYREVTILSGTFATGYGDKFDTGNLKILPSGSFYTEPANVPHYIEIADDVVLQVSGTGPSERRFINPPGSPK